MYIVDGIAYAGEALKDISVSKVKVLDDGILIITFSTGEERLFDSTTLLRFPAFASLSRKDIQESACVEDGILTWDNGNLDYATEALYDESVPYHSPSMAV